MKTSSKVEVQCLKAALKAFNIRNIIISPGSRNAPLSIALGEDPFFSIHVIVDERSAAFYAIGMAQQLNEPIVLACTSGSAPLNYFPAVVEAYYQRVPVIVLTADRPAEWIDQGDGQTIRQQHVFGTHVVDFFQCSPFYTEDLHWNARLRISEVLQTCIQEKAPVQINLPFTEPLYETVEEQEYPHQFVFRPEAERMLSFGQQEALRKAWNTHQKRMIIVGQGVPTSETQRLLATLAEDSSVVVLTEHTSNVKHEKFIQFIDRYLAVADEVEDVKPDLIVHMGGALVSKRIKKYLRSTAAFGVRIDHAFPFEDTFQQLRLSLDSGSDEALKFMISLIEHAPNNSNYAHEVHALNAKADARHEALIKDIPVSDFSVVKSICEALPINAQVHFSNSSMIRYGLLFPIAQTVWCNRGTSGIDGSTSTAAGAALANSSVLQVMVTGDLSFFYDSNALWNQHLPANLRVIVVNNGGGDIFKIIPGPDTTNQLEQIFFAKHGYQAAPLAKALGLETIQLEASAIETFDWEDFWASTEGAKLLEVNTSTVENAAVLRDYFKKMRM